MRCCNTCFEVKPLDQYMRYARDYGKICKPCIAKRKKAADIANKERLREQKRLYHLENKEHILAYQRQYREANKEKVQSFFKEYRKNNKHKILARNAKRKAAQLRAVPKWANDIEIQGFYKTSEGLSMLLGDYYHVDHIVPLQSKFVCGLHCESNLRVLSAKDNLSKNNRTWPDMW
jgi:hypothetical protein